MARSALRIFGWGVGVTLLLLVAAVNLVPMEYYKGLVSSLVRHTTAGRDLVIAGDVDIEFGSHITIIASDVTFSNPDSASRPHMFVGDRIELEVKLSPLLSGTLELRAIVQAADLLLEKDAEGNANWQLSANQQQRMSEDSASDDDSGSLRLLIRELRFDNAKIAYVDNTADRNHTATFESILLSTLGDRTMVEMTGQIDGHALALKGGTTETGKSVAGGTPGFDLEGKVASVNLKAAGMLSTWSTNADADLVVDASVPSLSVLSAFLARDLPDDGPLTATFKLSGNAGRWRLSDLKANLHTKLLAASVTGHTGELPGLDGIDLRVAVQTARLPAAMRRFGIEVPAELPDLKTLNASARVVSQNGKITGRDIDVALSGDGVQASVKGSVGDVLRVKDFDTDMQLDIGTLALLSKLVQQELPDSGPLSLSGKLSNAGGLDSRSDFSGTIKGDGLRLGIDGSIDDLLSTKGVSMAVDLEGASLRKVAKLAGREIPLEEPISLKGNLNLHEGQFRADDLIFTLADTEMSGNLNFTLPESEKGRPKLTAKLDLGSLDFESFSSQPFVAYRVPPSPVPAEQTADAEAESAAPPKRQSEASEVPPKSRRAAKQAAGNPEKILPDKPFPFELLRGVDADIDIIADEISNWRLSKQNIVLELDLIDGVLKLSFQADVGAGKAQTIAELDASKTPASFFLDYKMVDGSFRHFGGRYNMQTDVTGTGNSPAQIMAGLTGKVIVDARDLILDKSFMTNFGQSLINTLNPMAEKQETDELICGVARFDIKDGVADATDQFVAQFKDVTWFGGGTIDFKTEMIDLGAQSKPRKGLGLSAGSLAGLVQVRGPLTQPTIVPDPKNVAKQYGHFYLAVTTGGLWLLVKGMWDKSNANSDVCAELLSKKLGKESTILKTIVDSKKYFSRDPNGIPPPPKSDTIEREWNFGGDQ